MKRIHRNKYLRSSGRLALIILAISAYAFSKNHLCFAEVTSHLLEGIKLYQSGNYEEALNEFKAEIEFNKNCPLVYYYAAHIRLTKEQYPRAKQNLEAALRDSSDFHDAHGLLAFTLMKMGENTKAFTEWNSFIQGVGSIEENTPLTVESIMLPEEYHNFLKREARIKELERLETEIRERDRLKSEKEFEAKKTAASGKNIEAGSIIISDQQITDTSSQDDQIIEIETPLEDLEKRIKSSIRTGIYGIMSATAILGISVFTAVYWIRKRRIAKEEKNFSEEVERLLSDREFELDEEKALQEFETKRLELVQEKSYGRKSNRKDKTDSAEKKYSHQHKDIPDNRGNQGSCITFASRGSLTRRDSSHS